MSFVSEVHQITLFKGSMILTGLVIEMIDIVLGPIVSVMEPI